VGRLNSVAPACMDNQMFCAFLLLSLFLIGSQPSDHYFRSVCLFVCAEFFSAVFDPISMDICYMSGSSCVSYNIGAVRPLGAG